MDSDYHLQEETKNRIKEANSNGIRLHIWKRKELENYLLVPDAIQRLIVKSARKRKNLPDVPRIRKILMDIANRMKQDVIDSFAQEFRIAQPRLSVADWNEAARKLVEPSWGSFKGRMSRVGGKSLLSGVNRWAQEEFGVSFNNTRLAAELGRAEIDDEVVSFLRSFEDNEPLS